LDVDSCKCILLELTSSCFFHSKQQKNIMKQVAIIGTGYWGKNYVRIISELKEVVNLVCVCDLIESVALAFKAQYPNINVSTSVSDMLNTYPQIELVFVITPATTHFSVVKECLEAKKHVLVEKPLTTNADEGKQLCAIAKQNNVFLMCGHTYLFNNSVHEVKRLMEEKEFGKLFSLYCTRVALGPIRYDVGAEWDLAVHDVSIIQYLVKEKPKSVVAVGQNVLETTKGLVDSVYITLTYPSGLVANIQASWVDQEKIRKVVVVGSGRRIEFDDTVPADKVKYIDNGCTESRNEQTGKMQVTLVANQKQYTAAKYQQAEPLKAQVLHFIDSVKSGVAPQSNGEFGVEIVTIMDAIVKSIKSNGAIVQV